jgi:hypothetical protein
MPPQIGAVISARLASLHELQTDLGTEDLYIMLEILAVDAHNRRIMSQAKPMPT